jgi:hypothetical protein
LSRIRKNKKPLRQVFSFDFRLDDNQRLVLEVLYVRGYHWGYLTAISRNMLSDAPIVIGPTRIEKRQWLKLSQGCRAIAEKLIEHEDRLEMPEIY